MIINKNTVVTIISCLTFFSSMFLLIVDGLNIGFVMGFIIGFIGIVFSVLGLFDQEYIIIDNPLTNKQKVKSD